MKKKNMTLKEKEFWRGTSIILGSLCHTCIRPDLAVEIMNNEGITLEMLEESGVDKFDLDWIRKAIEVDSA